MWLEKLSTKKGTKFKYSERYLMPNRKYKKFSVTLDRKNEILARRSLSDKYTEALNKKKTDANILEWLIEDKDITLEQAHILHLESAKKLRHIKESTAIYYSYLFSSLSKAIPPQTLIKDLTAQFIELSITKHTSNIKAQQRLLFYIKQLLKWSYIKDYIDKPLHEKIINIADKGSTDISNKFLEKDELIKVIELARQINILYGIAFEFLSETGLRFGELAALTYKDIDFKNQTIDINKTYNNASKQVTTPKTKHSCRTISFNNNVLKLIKEISEINAGQQIQPIDNLLFAVNGSRLNILTANHYLSTIKKRLKLDKSLSTHTFRHTHTSLLFEKNMPLDFISRRLGHNGTGITKQIYLHITNEQKQKELNLFRTISVYS